MRALKCDICQKFFDPVEEAEIFDKRNEEPVNRIAFCESDDNGHEVKEVIDICCDCMTKMLESVNYMIIPTADRKKKKFRGGGNLNGNQI